MVMPDSKPDDLLSYAELSEYAATKGVTLTVSTLRAYKSAGRFPGADDETYKRVPRWRRDTFDRWLAERPGQGTRTDLAQKQASNQGEQ